MFHLTSSKNDRQADFVALGKKLAHVLDLDVQVMAPDFGANAQFLDLTAFVLFARFLQFLLALVAKLGKIRQFADRGVVLGSDLDEVRVLVLRDPQRFLDRPDS